MRHIIDYRGRKMSLSYSIVEKSCYIINRLPGEGSRSLLMGGFKEPSDNVKLPGLVKMSNLKVCEKRAWSFIKRLNLCVMTGLYADCFPRVEEL